MVGTLVMAPKSVTFRRHDHLVSVLFGDLLSHSYNITFSMFLYLVICGLPQQQYSPGLTLVLLQKWQIRNSIESPIKDPPNKGHYAKKPLNKRR